VWLCLHYQDIFVGHKGFWRINRKAMYYETYMRQQKNWKKWPDDVSIDEIHRLLQFVPEWNPKYKGESDQSLLDIFYEIRPTVKEFYFEKLENAQFDSEYLQKIKGIFDKVARYKNSYESNDASKILHIIIPNLFVMWDNKIREGVLGKANKKKGSMYALDFLPIMQKELLEAVETCMKEEKLEKVEAVNFIRKKCGNESLPKLVYEHNYCVFSKTGEFKNYLEKINAKDEVSMDVFMRLFEKMLEVQEN